MSAAQMTLLAAMAKSNDWPLVVRLFFAILSRPGAYCSAKISIQASATPALFDYPLCGENTDE